MSNFILKTDEVNDEVFIDLDTGKLFTEPEDLESGEMVLIEERLNWAWKRGIDAYADVGSINRSVGVENLSVDVAVCCSYVSVVCPHCKVFICVAVIADSWIALEFC